MTPGDLVIYTFGEYEDTKDVLSDMYRKLIDDTSPSFRCIGKYSCKFLVRL